MVAEIYSVSRMMERAYQPTDDERKERQIAEHCKDFAFDHELDAMQVMWRTGADTWTTIEIRAPSIMDDAPDGWVTTVRHESL